jgi:hypothetical protein
LIKKCFVPICSKYSPEIFPFEVTTRTLATRSFADY